MSDMWLGAVCRSALSSKPIIADAAIMEAPFEIMIDSSRSFDFWSLAREVYILAEEPRKDGTL
jgi:hypothetical protein